MQDRIDDVGGRGVSVAASAPANRRPHRRRRCDSINANVVNVRDGRVQRGVTIALSGGRIESIGAERVERRLARA